MSTTGTLNHEVTIAIKLELTARRLNESQLASRLNWGQGYINRRMRNEIPWSIDNLERVAGELDVSPLRLLDHPQLRAHRQTA